MDDKEPVKPDEVNVNVPSQTAPQSEITEATQENYQDLLAKNEKLEKQVNEQADKLSEVSAFVAEIKAKDEKMKQAAKSVIAPHAPSTSNSGDIAEVMRSVFGDEPALNIKLKESM